MCGFRKETGERPADAAPLACPFCANSPVSLDAAIVVVQRVGHPQNLRGGRRLRGYRHGSLDSRRGRCRHDNGDRSLERSRDRSRGRRLGRERADRTTQRGRSGHGCGAASAGAVGCSAETTTSAATTSLARIPATGIPHGMLTFLAMGGAEEVGVQRWVGAIGRTPVAGTGGGAVDAVGSPGTQSRQRRLPRTATVAVADRKSVV